MYLNLLLRKNKQKCRLTEQLSLNLSTKFLIIAKETHLFPHIS